MNKVLYLDGNGTKSFDRAMKYPDDAWEFTTEAPVTDDVELYSTVAAVFRAANLNADAIGSLPFALVSKNGEDFDNSEDWQNKVKFMKFPGDLFRLFRMSLFFTGKAYGFMETKPMNLRYIVPSTISIITQKAFPHGIEAFRRTIGNSHTDYSVDSKRIVYLFRMDHTTELLPSENTEFRALMAAAGVLHYSDYYVNKFLSRGGIKPSMLMMKGVPDQETREKVEKIWDRLISGYYKYRAKIFNADSIDVKVIGEGIENMANSQMYRDKLADIAMAAGIPLSLLLSNSANYATAQAEYVSWFRDSIVPWANFIAKELNWQLFEPMGLKLEFKPEMTDPGQESEVKRAAAYKTYVDSGMLPSVAAQVVGIDLPSGVDYESLDKKEEEPKEPETVVDEVVEKPEEEIKVEPAKYFIPSIDQYEALAFWRDLCNRKMKRGEAVDFDFQNEILPNQVKNIVKCRLAGVKDAEGVKSAFEMNIPVSTIKAEQSEEVLQLAASINKAVEAL